MSEFDLHNNVDDRVALTNQSITTNTTTDGEIIDTKGFESIEFIYQSGALNAGAFALLLREGDAANLSDVADVPSEETLGALTGFAATDDDATIRVGSIGKKRYQRASIVSTGASGANLFSAVAVLGTPHTAPVAQ